MLLLPNVHVETEISAREKHAVGTYLAKPDMDIQKKNKICNSNKKGISARKKHDEFS